MRAVPVTRFAVLAAGLLAAGLAAAQAPAKTYSLKFNHVLGPKEPYHEGFNNWARRVEERTRGGLKMEVFHSAQLGKEEDIIEQMRQGANLGQNTDSARLGNYVPAMAVMSSPRLSRRAAGGGARRIVQQRIARRERSRRHRHAW